MCVDCVLASPRIAQVDPGDEPLLEVVLSHPPPDELATPPDPPPHQIRLLDQGQSEHARLLVH
jgi:hypothetical protein